MIRVLVVVMALVVAETQGLQAQFQPDVPSAVPVHLVPCGQQRTATGSPSRGPCGLVGLSVGLSSVALTQPTATRASTLNADTRALLHQSLEGGSRARTGAVLGALVGIAGTYLVLHHGGSTSLCDASANQDAMGRRECLGLTVLGGLAGAGLGAWIGGRFQVRP